MSDQKTVHGKWISLAAFLAIAITAISGTSSADSVFQPHTTIPVVFPHTLNSMKLKAGDTFALKTSQVIFLTGGERIPKGSLVVAQVLKSDPSQGGTPGSVLEFKFKEIRTRDRVIPASLYFRAVANFVQAHEAALPNVPPDGGSPGGTTQVGGDQVYPGDKVYSFTGRVVGKASADGVFAYLRSSESDSGSVCDASDDLQSVGIFSASACGLYGLSHLTLDQSSASEPTGVIHLSSDKQSVKIPGGSEALLELVPGEI